MNEYTIIILHKWDKHGDGIKEIFHNHNLKWNLEKIMNLKYEELLSVFNKFQLTKLDFNIDENDIGLSGIWENEKEAVKIIKIENNDNVILIYKSIESIGKEFYIEFLKKCKDISYLIRKIVDNKITFEKRLNIDLFETLNDINEEKKIKIKNFKIRTEMIEGFSDEFKKKWIECIKNS